MVGTFYRAPKPGAPPFVDVGAEVGEHEVIGIIETMKLMNSISAGAVGDRHRDLRPRRPARRSAASHDANTAVRQMNIRRIFIANRGEIAVRIIRTCRSLGVETVVAASEADLDGVPARLADRTICIGPPRSSDSYLNVEAIVDAAVRAKADAVHPGYGFLSENVRLARACRARGLVFIGPTEENHGSRRRQVARARPRGGRGPAAGAGRSRRVARRRPRRLQKRLAGPCSSRRSAAAADAA